MARVNNAQLKQAENEINITLNGYGYPYLVMIQASNGKQLAHLRDNKSRVIESLVYGLTKAEMLLWLEAYTKGIRMGYNLKGAK